MTIYRMGPKVNEKTFPVNIGQDERDMITSIQNKIEVNMGYKVTQRAVVTRAIRKMHEEIFQKT